MFSTLSPIAFVSLLLLQTVSSIQFTLDPCCQDSDCGEGRQCTIVGFNDDGFFVDPCAPGKEDCSCTQGVNGFVPCEVDLECLEGDVCDSTQEGGFCVSHCFLANDGRRELEEDEKTLCDSQPSFPRICPPLNPMDGSESTETSEENVTPTPSPISQPMPDADVEPSDVEEPTASDEAGEPESTPFEDLKPELTPFEDLEPKSTPFGDLEPREAGPTTEPEEILQIVVTTPPPVSVTESSPTGRLPEVTPTPEVKRYDSY